jgi:hypothetical protein
MLVICLYSLPRHTGPDHHHEWLAGTIHPNLFVLYEGLTVNLSNGCREG